MKITAEITRKDLALLNIYLLPRLKANWIFLGVMILIIAIFLAITKSPSDISGYCALAIGSVFGGLGGVIIGFIINIIMMLLTVGKKSGVLGIHHYELLPEGIKESTTANESLQRWGAIVTVRIHGNYLLFRVNNYLFHVIPKRAFESEENFMSFYSEAVRLKGTA